MNRGKVGACTKRPPASKTSSIPSPRKKKDSSLDPQGVVNEHPWTFSGLFLSWTLGIRGAGGGLHGNRVRHITLLKIGAVCASRHTFTQYSYIAAPINQLLVQLVQLVCSGLRPASR